MKKAYVTPSVDMIEFRYREQVVAASAGGNQSEGGGNGGGSNNRNFWGNTCEVIYNYVTENGLDGVVCTH